MSMHRGIYYLKSVQRFSEFNGKKTKSRHATNIQCPYSVICVTLLPGGSTLGNINGGRSISRPEV